MEARARYAFCTSRGEISRMVFEHPDQAEMWASRSALESPGTLYMHDGTCWMPVMVFGLSDDDASVLARGMAFVSAVDCGDYAEALEDYLSCEEMPESVKDALRRELLDRP